MRTPCPNCGADVEFRYDDSFVRVCDHCRNAVLRTDRGVETLGRVADLVPMESPLALFADGRYAGASFMLVGMAQLKHAAGGMWQEWYAKIGDRWGWLAEAQGRYYLTFEEKVPQLPAPETIAPGLQLTLWMAGQPHVFTVGEHGTASYLAAAGELPYKLVPAGTFRFVDLSDGVGNFATIDYGEPGDPPALYVGRQVTLAELALHGGEHGPPREAAIRSQRLACPTCNAPVELAAPGQAQRYACSHCNSLLDTSGGALAVLGQLATRAVPGIPLGSKCTFVEGELTVIGYVQRSAGIDGQWYPFEEYLLYQPKLGFRWLVQSDGHWSYVQPIAVGAVESNLVAATYDGVTFKMFQRATLRVDQVLGEFYWQVATGEQVESEDYIRPPAMLSLERAKTEESWSLSTYLTIDEVKRAFGEVQLAIGPTIGKAPNQPSRASAAGNVLALAAAALVVAGIAFASCSPNKLRHTETVNVPPAGTLASLGSGSGSGLGAPTLSPSVSPTACVDYERYYAALPRCAELAGQRESLAARHDAVNITRPTPAECVGPLADLIPMLTATCPALADELAAAGAGSGSGSAATAPEGVVAFSEPFELAGGQNIELEFHASGLTNTWAFISADLVDEQRGGVVPFEAGLEYYAGIDDGESWSEGSRSHEAVVGPQPGGKYVLRVEAQQGGSQDLVATVTVRQGVFRGKYLALALLVLLVPLVIVGLVSWSFERQRWENSTTGKMPWPPLLLVVIAIVFPVILTFWIVKGIARASANSTSSSDD